MGDNVYIIKRSTAQEQNFSTCVIIVYFSRTQFNSVSLFLKKIHKEHQNILAVIHGQDWSVNLPSGSRMGGCYYVLYCNMKTIL